MLILNTGAQEAAAMAGIDPPDAALNKANSS
jgi:hypothetical protein